MTHDGISVNGLHSHYDFGLCFAGRRDAPPAKNSRRETVPYMNGYHDFSAIGGEVSWGERRLEYDFDLIADTPQQLERARTAVLGWLCGAHEAAILDDTAPDYHYLGSFDGVELDEDESGCKVSLTVRFVCQPFRIANRQVRVRLAAGENGVTNPGQSVLARVDCEGTCTIAMNGQAQAVSGAGVELLAPLRHGLNRLTLEGDAATLRYVPEVI